MLVWTKEIDEDFLKALLEEPSTQLLLSSPGGGTYVLGAALDHMSARDWTTRGTGCVMSAAVPILASGAKGRRSASPLCRFMVHAPAIHLNGEGEETIKSLSVDRAELEYADTVYFAALAERTGTSEQCWRALCDGRDYYFDAKTAKKLGVVDRVQ